MAKGKGRVSPEGGRTRGHATNEQLDKRPEIKYQHGYAQLAGKRGESLESIIEKAQEKFGKEVRIEAGLHYSDNKIHWSYGSGQFPGIDADYLERVASKNDRSLSEQVQFDSKIRDVSEGLGSPDRYVIRVHYR